MATNPIPEGYHTATPYLIVNDGAKAIDFYQKAFGAKELFRMAMPDGKLMHAEIMVGDSPIMLSDEHPAMGAKSPTSYGGTPVSLMLYVPDVDQRFQTAIAAGARQVRPVQDQFYGDRSGTLTDPFGHMWTVSTHVEDVPADELRRRSEAMMKEACRE